MVLALAAGTWPLSKRWLKDWGSRPEERARAWHGDRYVLPDHGTTTRGIDVAAPADEVWPWIAQFGLGRAGFYSYELLERIIGIPVINVESVEPTWQSLEAGDEVSLHPSAPGIPVAHVEAGRDVCFGVERGAGAVEVSPGPAPGRSWSFYLEPATATSCRLLVRGCLESTRGAPWSTRAASALEEPIDFVMEQRMLRTIKRLAESNIR